MRVETTRKEHQLQINGHHLTAFEYNASIDSIPVIFIHGIANSIGLWEPIQVPLVSENYHWFSLSLPGHYPAKWSDKFESKDLTPNLMADLMSEAVRQLTNGKSAILVGYSTGGYASLCIAHHAPELVERMILLDGFAKGVWGAGLRIAQIIANLKGIGETVFAPYAKMTTFTLGITRLVYNLVGTDLKAMAKHPKMDEIVKINWDAVQAGNPMQLYPYFRYMFHTDISDWLPEIETETLILHGSVDRVIIPQHAEHMDKQLPNSRLQWIDGSGHLPFVERSQLFEQYITDWLRH